jgi:hypothetical protein
MYRAKSEKRKRRNNNNNNNKTHSLHYFKVKIYINIEHTLTNSFASSLTHRVCMRIHLFIYYY